MRYLFVAVLTLQMTLSFGQTEAIDYQTILKDAQGDVLNLVDAEVQVDLKQGSANGTTVYSEIHQVSTGLNGEISISVGKGNPLGSNFSELDWENPHFIEIAVKPEGFTSFINVGSVQLLTVPYAIFALKLTCEQGCPGGDSSAQGPQGMVGDTGPQGGNGATGPSGNQGPQGPRGLSGVEALNATAVIPTNPDNGQLYIDDGSNRADGLPGFRYYNGSQWINL